MRIELPTTRLMAVHPSLDKIMICVTDSVGGYGSVWRTSEEANNLRIKWVCLFEGGVLSVSR